MKAAATKHRRVNVTLEEETLGLIDRVGKKAGFNRSRFLDAAARRFVRELGRTSLRKLLEEEARVNRERDLALVEEWAAVDAEAWPSDDQPR